MIGHSMLGFYHFTSGHCCKKYTGPAQPCQIFWTMQSKYVDPFKRPVDFKSKKKTPINTQDTKPQNWPVFPFVQICTCTDRTAENQRAAQERLLVFSRKNSSSRCSNKAETLNKAREQINTGPAGVKIITSGYTLATYND